MSPKLRFQVDTEFGRVELEDGKERREGRLDRKDAGCFLS